MGFKSGRHFLQIPGPTNVPDRILRAIDRPTIDHRGPEFAALTRELAAGTVEGHEAKLVHDEEGDALVALVQPCERALVTGLEEAADEVGGEKFVQRRKRDGPVALDFRRRTARAEHDRQRVLPHGHAADHGHDA